MRLTPVIDLFAGPGGLGEGFSAVRSGRHPVFRIALSIEKDANAHSTLELRSFYRRFGNRQAPAAYYQHLRGELSREELFARHPEEARRAKNEAWHAELGNEKDFPASTVDRRIRQALAGSRTWVLIGGPPCQAYSLIGRARLGLDDVAEDPHERHDLYRHYLRILAVHRPPVFVMENVEGILSATAGGRGIFKRILKDLQQPGVRGTPRAARRAASSPRYRLFPVVQTNVKNKPSDEPVNDPRDYVIRAEKHGLPQTRHRVILLGIREDLDVQPLALKRTTERVSMWNAIADLPRIRSSLSREPDSPEAWVVAISGVLLPEMPPPSEVELDMRTCIRRVTDRNTMDGLAYGCAA